MKLLTILSECDLHSINRIFASFLAASIEGVVSSLLRSQNIPRQPSGPIAMRSPTRPSYMRTAPSSTAVWAGIS